MEKFSDDNKQKFENFVKNIIKENKVKEMAIKAFYKTGEVVYEKYLGYKNEEKKLPIDENTNSINNKIICSYSNIVISRRRRIIPRRSNN